jgi:hypothetical protein
MTCYADVRDSIRSGDLIALTHEAWGSFYDLQVQAVRTFTQSEYSHVCVAWVIGGRVFVIESVTPMVRIMPLSNLQDKGFYWIPTAVPMTDAELEFGLARVGLGEYSKIQAIEGQLGTLDIGGDELWMCAELVIAMRRLSGLDLGPKATPAAVVKKALEQGYDLRFVLRE